MGVTHEKLVKGHLVDAPLLSGVRLLLLNLMALFLTRVLVGLQRPIGQSLIRALRHIIEFDSGLLIRQFDLQLTPGS
jgi:hypothetical protein